MMQSRILNHSLQFRLSSKKHHQTTFRVMEASEVRRLKRIPCRQVLQEIFDGKFIELKNGMLQYKQYVETNNQCVV